MVAPRVGLARRLPKRPAGQRRCREGHAVDTRDDSSRGPAPPPHSILDDPVLVALLLGALLLLVFLTWGIATGLTIAAPA